MKVTRKNHTLLPALIAAASVLISATSCSKTTKVTEAPAVAVSVMHVTSWDGSAPKTFSGTVEAADNTPVSFSVPGTIEEMYVDEGRKVAKGQVIARLKSGSLVNASNIAQAELEQARDAYTRLKKLHDADALPDIKWVEMQSKLKQAENAAELARRAVDDATIHAPVAGVVSRRLADKGETVLAAQPVVEIVGLGKLKMSVSVPEEEITSIADGSDADIVIGSLDNMKIKGRNAVKAVVADPLTRSYSVKFDIDNPDGKILPGMIGELTLLSAATAAQAPSSVMLPPQAVLLSADNRSFVWVVDNGRAARRFVETDGMEASGVLVNKGIERGDSVIVAGMQKVSSGTPVTDSE